MKPKSSESQRVGREVGADAVDLGVADVGDDDDIILRERARIDDLDLVVLPLHLERGEVERVTAAIPAALETELIVVQEVGIVIRRQHDPRRGEVAAAGPEPVREQRVDHRVLVDVVLHRQFLGDVAGRRLAFLEVIARVRSVAPPKSSRSRVWSNQRSPAVKLQRSFGE